MSGRWSRRIGRRGVNLIGLIVIILAMVGIGAGLMNLSQQAGRSGHWFHHSQLAHDLADAGMKQCFYQLVQNNSAASTSSGQGFMAAELQQVFRNITGGTTGEVMLYSSRASGTPPPALATLLTKLKDFSPILEVKLVVGAPEPLWNGALQGIPSDPAEKKGAVSIIAHATVKAPAGIKVERTIRLDKSYKVINLVPPLLGRFALFVLDGPASADEPNVVPVQYDHTGTPPSGNGSLTGARPLTLESVASATLVAAGSNRLERQQFVRSLTQDPQFLDKQGWVYLGGAQPWELKLAHGWSEGGESPLLPGYEPAMPIPDQQFSADFEAAAVRASPHGCVVSATPQTPPRPGDLGLYNYWHGMAENYELIGVPRKEHPRMQSGSGRAPLMDFGPGKTSFVRLFGDPEKCSPTLVFGPVQRVMMQRAFARFSRPAGSFTCPKTGKVKMHMFMWDQGLPKEKQLIKEAFQGNKTRYDELGTTLQKTPFATSLGVVLSAKGDGAYWPSGLLGPNGAGGTNQKYTSSLFDKLGTVDPDRPIDPQVLVALANGRFDSASFYTGNLSDGFKAFLEVVKAKTTYEMTPAAFQSKVLVSPQGGGAGKELKIPGVVMVDSTALLKLPAIGKVQEGGIIWTQGPVQITGNIVTGPPPPGAAVQLPPPLTIVSTKGDITIDPSVSTVEAHLVALEGTVKIGSQSGITITGGICAKKIDPGNAAGPGKRRIKHHEAIDPKGGNAAVTKIFYGGDDKLAVSGSAP